MNTAPAIDTTNRESVIAWLVWNDPNGSYTDHASEVEGYDPLTLEEAVEYYLDQRDG